MTTDPARTPLWTDNQSLPDTWRLMRQRAGE